MLQSGTCLPLSQVLALPASSSIYPPSLFNTDCSQHSDWAFCPCVHILTHTSSCGPCLVFMGDRISPEEFFSSLPSFQLIHLFHRKSSELPRDCLFLWQRTCKSPSMISCWDLYLPSLWVLFLKVLCSPGWCQTQCATEVSLELLVLLPPPLECKA